MLILSLVVQTLTSAGPLLLASLGEVFSERVGVVNIGLEGLLLIGALTAVVVAVATGSPWLALLAAVLAGLAGGALFALFAVGMKRDQVIVGTTMNFLALGLTGVLYRAWAYGPGMGKTAPTLPRLTLPGGAAGGINAVTVLTLLLVPLAHWLLFRTRIGLALRTTGEVPAAAAAAGYSVNRLRVLVCLATGALCGAGGAALSIGISNTFTEGMTNGRGFIALAIVVFGRWMPLGALGASLLFAAADIAQSQLQASGRLGQIPYPVILALPYLLTLLALAVRGARVRPPAALGRPFEQA